MSVRQQIAIGPVLVRLEQTGEVVEIAGNYQQLHSSTEVPDLVIRVELTSDFRLPDSREVAEYPAFHSARRSDGVLEFARTDAAGIIRCPESGPMEADFQGLAMPHSLEAVIRLAASIALPPHGALILHSSAIEDRSGAHVFSGVSGAGKSTIAAMLSEQAGFRRLSDELLLLVRRQDGWVLEVAPFTGKVELPWGESRPLASIHLLEQSPSDERTPLSAVEAMTELPRHVVTYAHDPAIVRSVLELLGEIVETIPCYRLKFRKSPKVAEVLRLSCD